MTKYTVCILSSVFGVLAAGAAPVDRPNVILINIDNHDKGSLSYFGNTFIETPHIGRLFEQGLRLQNYHTAGRCTSSRSALMTGRYHARNGALGTGGAWGQSASDTKTIGDVFREGGYQTSMFGKWHLGDSHGLRPEDRGFDEVCAFENGAYLSGAVVKPGYNGSARTAESHRFNHNGTYELYEGLRTDVWFHEAMRYIEFQRDSEKPFFMYLATITAHGPHFGPQDLQAYYKEKYERDEFKWIKDRFSAKNAKGTKGVTSYPYDHAADIGSLDRNVGRLMDKLEALDLLKNTIVVYMSDGSGSGPASAGKDKIHSNELSQNPATILWPGTSKGLDIEGPAIANMDILPTFAEICGIKLGANDAQELDGQSFASLLGVEQAAKWKDRVYISDHQSTGDRDGFNYQMALRPFNVTDVTLPEGKILSWKSGKRMGTKYGPETESLATQAYEKWFKYVLNDFPLGAYVRTHDDEKPVFLRSYPIVDGPGGKGVHTYFLLDVEADGTYEFDSNISDYFGAERTSDTGKIKGKIAAFRKSVDGHLPVEFDSEMKVYRTLPATLAKSFKQEVASDFRTKADLQLKAGRYLICVDTGKVNKAEKPPKIKMRVQRKR